MTDITIFRSRVHGDFLFYRRLERLIEQDNFEEAYEVANVGDLTILETILKSKSIDAVREWIKLHLDKSLELKPYGELRRLAAEAHILRYSRMNRTELILALKKVLHETSVD